MAKKYQKFSPEFREETARLVVDGQKSIAEVAREHGLSDTGSSILMGQL
ncbi:transposase [Mycolicibacterium tusciae]|nr:transposase [Mycolicibacterium tusciae]